MSLPPGTRALRLAVADLNGQARGKRVDAREVDKVQTDGARMPLSVLNVDVAGNDIEGSPLVFDTGDQDGVLTPTDRGMVPAPWLATPTALVPMWMHLEDASPFDGDPRQALAAVLARYAEWGWAPQVATELEFYLVDDSARPPVPAASPRSGRRRTGADIHSLRALDAFDAFFSDLYAGAEAMGIRAGAAISEAGAGQFEVDLVHGPAMRIADDTWLFKLLTQGLARKHGFAASFMAKPFADQPGSGLHAHVSVLDAAGRNIFDDGRAEGTPVLGQAVAGCLLALPESLAVLAPHGASFARFVDHAHAPTAATWGYDNRTTAIRIPGGAPAARRFEHRVAGADANPYLYLAVVLGAALDGITTGPRPPAPVTGDAYGTEAPSLHRDWDAALTAFETGATMAKLLPRQLIGNFVLTKRQEMRDWAAMDDAARLARYLDLL